MATYNFIALNVIITWSRILELTLSVYSLPVANLGSQIIIRNQLISPGSCHHKTGNPTDNYIYSMKLYEYEKSEIRNLFGGSCHLPLTS